MLLLVLNQPGLRSFHFYLQVGQLFGEPIGGLHGAVEPGLDVLFNERIGDGVSDLRCEPRVGTGILDFNN